MGQLKHNMQVKVYLGHRSERLLVGNHSRVYLICIPIKCSINSLVWIKSYTYLAIYLQGKKTHKYACRCQYRLDLKPSKLSIHLFTEKNFRYSMDKKYLVLLRKLIWLASSNNHAPNLIKLTIFLRVWCTIIQSGMKSKSKLITLNNNT